MPTASQKAAARARARQQRRRSRSPSRKARSRSPSRSPSRKARSPSRRKTAKRPSTKSRSSRTAKPARLQPPAPRDTVKAYLSRHKFLVNTQSLPQTWTPQHIWACWSALPSELQSRHRFAELLRQYAHSVTAAAELPRELIGNSFRTFAEDSEKKELIGARMKVAESRNAFKEDIDSAQEVLENVVRPPQITKDQHKMVEQLARQTVAQQETVERLDKLTTKAATATTPKERVNINERIRAAEQKLDAQQKRSEHLKSRISSPFGIAIALLLTGVGMGIIGTTENSIRGKVSEISAREGLLPWLGRHITSSFKAPSWLQTYLGGGGTPSPAPRHGAYERLYHRYVSFTHDARWSAQQAMADLHMV